MTLSNKRIEDIEETDLQGLVSGGVPEGRLIEYKLVLPSGGDSDKKEFLADVSSFANASGGDIVYGMKEYQGAAAELVGIPARDWDAERLRLEEIIRNGIAPRIPGLTIKVVPLESSGAALVIRIPRSFAKPHMVVFKGSSRFFSRNTSGKYQLDVTELRAAFLISGDLTNFWKDWSEATDPPISPDLVISGRRDEAERIVAWLRDAPSPLAIQADSRKEALAFFAAAVEILPPKERESCIARSVVVGDVTAWRQVVIGSGGLVLIPMFEERDIAARAAREGHHVLIPLGREDSVASTTVKLQRPLRGYARDALEGMGLRGERAEELAALARRSLTALRRKLAIAPEVQSPAWAKPSEARALTPVILVGTWNDASAGDREVVARLARKSYGEVDGALARWSNESDPPARRVGDLWLLVSKEDAWGLLARFLTREDLENFESVVVDVLGAADETYDLPAGRRYLAEILGKSLPYSGWLMGELADTVALMAARGDSLAQAGGESWQERANRIVWKLLHRANTDWRIWASLSDHLPLLAEAAPEVFLDAVEAGLSGERPVLLNLFSEDENSFLGGSPHTGLLWALERLAWHPDFLGHASLLLSKLTRLDPGGKMANRPGRSLREIFLFWLPQTAASLESRLRVLDLVRRREPQVAWSSTLLSAA